MRSDEVALERWRQAKANCRCAQTLRCDEAPGTLRRQNFTDYSSPLIAPPSETDALSRGDEMSHFGLTSRTTLYAFLQSTVRLNRAGMLAKVLRPGMHQERFEIAVFFL